jgi:hypothetical protein
MVSPSRTGCTGHKSKDSRLIAKINDKKPLPDEKKE